MTGRSAAANEHGGDGGANPELDWDAGKGKVAGGRPAAKSWNAQRGVAARKRASWAAVDRCTI